MEHKIEKKEKTDLNELVEKIVKLSIPDSIVCNLEKLPEVLCDPDKLSRVFKNLLDNAVIHADPKKIEIKKRIYEEKLEILIINDGEMIPEKNHKRIFERGFSTKRRSGIGLIIAKKYVEAHGWELRLETTEKTTSFIISIPQNI
jgi:two-component system sensor histidine kinase VanS